MRNPWQLWNPFFFVSQLLLSSLSCLIDNWKINIFCNHTSSCHHFYHECFSRSPRWFPCNHTSCQFHNRIFKITIRYHLKRQQNALKQIIKVKRLICKLTNVTEFSVCILKLLKLSFVSLDCEWTAVMDWLRLLT